MRDSPKTEEEPVLSQTGALAPVIGFIVSEGDISNAVGSLWYEFGCVVCTMQCDMAVKTQRSHLYSSSRQRTYSRR